MTAASRLVLGTVQLGMSYGVANRRGQPSLAEAEALIRAAWTGGVREFDTAQAYGQSEEVLGNIFRTLDITREARVITKPHPDAKLESGADAESMLKESLQRLGVSHVHGLMLHREDFLDAWEQGLKDILMPLKEQGLVRRFGVSVYSPAMANRALEMDGIDIIQLPSNLWDRRFEQAGVFSRAQTFKKTIYIRSAYLQGLLLMEPHSVPDGLSGARPYLERLGELCRQTGLSRAALALAYIRLAFPAARCVLGAETREQVLENIALWESQVPVNLVDIVRDDFQDVPEELLNPAMWSQ